MSSRSPYPPDPENAKRRSTLMTRTRSACRCARRRRASSRITDEGAVFAFLAFGFAGCRARDRGPRRTGRLGTTWHGFPDKRQSAGTNGGNVGQADAEIPHKRSDATKALRLGSGGRRFESCHPDHIVSTSYGPVRNRRAVSVCKIIAKLPWGGYWAARVIALRSRRQSNPCINSTDVFA